MAGEWRDLRWGDLATLEYGRALRSYDTSSGRFRVFGTNGPIGWHDKALCSHPGVIIGRKGAYRGVHYSSAPFFVIDTAFYLEPKVEMDLRWAYYELLTQDINGMDSGSAIPSTSREAFYSLLVRVPPPDEQRAIACILRTLDDKIELNRRMNETLEAMARALFKSWFVDFDPVRAKAEGRDPGFPKAIADLFPDRFVDSQLGKIPEGWDVGPLLNHATLLSGGTPKTEREDYWGGHILWASARDVSQSGDTFLVTTARTITEKGLEESATQVIPAFCTVVVARGATTGRMVLFGREMAMNQTCYGLASKRGTPFTLYCQLRNTINDLVHSAHGSVFDTITTSTFSAAKVVLPPTSIIESFDKAVSSIFRKILTNTEESSILAALRDALLPKLLSGEIRIKDAKKKMATGVVA